MEMSLTNYIKGIEIREIVKALEATGNNRTQAAALLGINRTTLCMKMKRYKLEHKYPRKGVRSG